MATTVPMGIITTLAPPLPPGGSRLGSGTQPSIEEKAKAAILRSRAQFTPSPGSSSRLTGFSTSTLSSIASQQLLPDDSSSTAEDYSYFQQTDDYKYFGKDRKGDGGPTTKMPRGNNFATDLPQLDDDDDDGELLGNGEGDGEDDEDENGFDDYWIDLDDSKHQQQQPQNLQNHRKGSEEHGRRSKASSERRLVTKELMDGSDRTSVNRRTTAPTSAVGAAAAPEWMLPKSSQELLGVTISTIDISDADPWSSTGATVKWDVAWICGLLILQRLV